MSMKAFDLKCRLKYFDFDRNIIKSVFFGKLLCKKRFVGRMDGRMFVTEGLG